MPRWPDTNVRAALPPSSAWAQTQPQPSPRRQVQNAHICTTAAITASALTNVQNGGSARAYKSWLITSREYWFAEPQIPIGYVPLTEGGVAAAERRRI